MLNVADDVNYLANCVVKFGAIDVFVESVCMIITAREIDGGNFKFWRDNRNVGKGTLRSLETFAGNVSLEVRISATIENGVIFSFAVKLDKEIEVVEFFWKLKLLMGEAESFSPNSPNFLVASE